MPVDLLPAVELVDRRRRELKQYLEALDKAPIYLKAQPARDAAASLQELFTAQHTFNLQVITAVHELRADLRTRPIA
jgi:hypothetical protein